MYISRKAHTALGRGVFAENQAKTLIFASFAEKTHPLGGVRVAFTFSTVTFST